MVRKIYWSSGRAKEVRVFLHVSSHISFFNAPKFTFRSQYRSPCNECRSSAKTCHNRCSNHKHCKILLKNVPPPSTKTYSYYSRSQGGYLSALNDGATVQLRPYEDGWGEWRRSDAGGGNFTLQSRARGTYLSADWKDGSEVRYVPEQASAATDSAMWREDKNGDGTGVPLQSAQPHVPVGLGGREGQNDPPR